MHHARLSDIVRRMPDYQPNALPVAQAQAIIHALVQTVKEVEAVDIFSALGRVLAEDIPSPINVPPHDNSAMDGYAFSGADLHAVDPTQLSIVGDALAGRAFEGLVGSGQCIRIMTGAVMPEGCDTVIPQELVASHTPIVVTIAPGTLRAGDNRRHKGEDLKQGTAALAQGRLVHAADLGLLASLGLAHIPVRRRVKVAFFSTGDELRSLGQTLDAGCLYDSNRYTLFGMLTRLGCELVDMGVIPDEPVALEAAFRSACAQADAIITSGGVSVGAADYTKQIMQRLGDVTFWTIGMRPGRPMAVGTVTCEGKSAYVFGLPGNPVAVMVTFYFFVRDALLRVMGATAEPLPLMSVISMEPIRKKRGRTEYQRGILARNAAGQQTVRITGSQGSGVLRSMSEANCMMVLHHEQGDVAAGDYVDVLVFDGLT